MYLFYDALTKVSAGIIVFSFGLFIVAIVMFFQVSEKYDSYKPFGKRIGRGVICLFMLVSFSTSVGAYYVADYSHKKASKIKRLNY